MQISFRARLATGFFAFTVLALAQSSTPTSGIDLQAIDKSVNPCQDFFRYGCGAWIKENPIPADQTRWGRFNELRENNQKVLHEILEDSAKHQDRSAVDQKIGAFYSSCMDEGAIEKAGYKPIQAGLERIASIKEKSQLPAEVAWLQGQGVGPLFNFRSSPDPDKSTMTIADIDQGGLGLPDRSYYLDEKDANTREKYRLHVSRMLQLVGEAPETAGANAKVVLAIESSLATASLERTKRRDPHLIHHMMKVEELQALTPDFNYKQYFSERGSPSFDTLNVAVPDFFKNLNTVIGSNRIADLKTYLTWHYVSANANLLTKAFVDENFDFYGKFLTGAQQLEPRWKRCVDLTDRALGEALGQKYVDKAFTGKSKEKTQELVAVIEKEMAADIDSLTWMSDKTKEQALAKLRAVTNKIGYPEKWRDYSSVTIVDGKLVADERRAREFDIKREIERIGKPVDRKEFRMTPPTVNAYYNPLENNINFPAGILQPPFYTNTADMAINFGGIGAVIGHELTHGFDDQGRQFDADGNLRDWWTKQDQDEFKKRADCIANEYSGFSPVPDGHINGRLTLGENGADNAGVRLAFMALEGGLENGTVSKEKLDGFTPEQRFFLGYAQVWCANQRPESLRVGLRTDPHSPGEFRVVGVVENMPAFAKAFGCSAGQPMVAANGCRVW